MFTFGVSSFIWTENFGTADLWVIAKAKELGFDTIDLTIAHPATFPTARVKEEARRVGIEVVTTTTLGKDTNLISPDAATRRRRKG